MRRQTVLACTAAAVLVAGASGAFAKGPGGGTTSAGTISVNPSSTAAGTASNYVLRYQAKGGFTHKGVSFGVPHGFTVPTIGGSGPGNVSVLKGTCTWIGVPTVSGSATANWVDFTDVSCPKGGNFLQIGYNNAMALVADAYTFAGFSNGSPAAPASVTVVPGAGVALNFWQSPADGPAGSALSPAPVVSVFDAYGNAISGGDVTLSLLQYPSGSPAAFNAGDNTIAPVNGLATFPGMKVNTAGVYTLAASRAGVSNSTVPFTINPAAPAQLVFLAPIADTAADSILGGGTGVRVAIQDAYGNLETGDNATVVNAAIKAPNTPAGTLSGFSGGPTAVNGIATFPNLSINRQGVYTLTASAAPGLSADSNAFTINARVNRPLTGAGNWSGVYGTQEWWLFEYALPTSVSPDVPPNLTVNTDGAGATLGDLTTSGASGWSYSGDTSDDRALQNPCFAPAFCGGGGIDTSIQRASGALFSATTFNTVLQFTNAFTGKLTVYAVDWDSASRAQSVTVHDALGDQTVALTSFVGGAYATFNVTTGNASNVTVTATNDGGALTNAVIAGMFLN